MSFIKIKNIKTFSNEFLFCVQTKTYISIGLAFNYNAQSLQHVTGKKNYFLVQ